MEIGIFERSFIPGSFQTEYRIARDTAAARLRHGQIWVRGRKAGSAAAYLKSWLSLKERGGEIDERRSGGIQVQEEGRSTAASYREAKGRRLSERGRGSGPVPIRRALLSQLDCLTCKWSLAFRPRGSAGLSLVHLKEKQSTSCFSREAMCVRSRT